MYVFRLLTYQTFLKLLLVLRLFPVTFLKLIYVLLTYIHDDVSQGVSRPPTLFTITFKRLRYCKRVFGKLF